MQPGRYGPGAIELDRYQAYLNSAAHHEQILRWIRYGYGIIERHQEDRDSHRCVVCLEPCDCMDVAEETYEALGEAWANCTHGNVSFPCDEIIELAKALRIEVKGA